MTNEQIENFELSANQKRFWFLNDKNFKTLYTHVSIRLLNQIDTVRLTEILNQIVITHETLSSRLTVDESSIFPLQTPNYHQKAFIEILAANAYENGSNQTAFESNESDIKTTAPIQFVLFADAENNVQRLALKAHSFWIDLFGCFKIIENIQTILAGEKITNEEDEEFIVHKNFAAWQNELLLEEDNEGLAFWASYSYDLTKRIIPFGRKSTTDFQPKKIQLAKISGDKITSLSNAFEQEDLEFQFLTSFIHFLRNYEESNFTLGYTLFDRIYEELNETVGLVTKAVPLEIDADFDAEKPASVEQLLERIEQIKDWSDYYGQSNFDGNQEQQKFKVSFQFVDANRNLEKIDSTDCVIESIFSTQETFEIKLCITQLKSRFEIDLYYDDNVFNTVEIAVIKEQLLSALKHTFTATYFEAENSEIIPSILNQLNVSEDNEVEINSSVLDLIQQQVELHPNAIAIHSDAEQVTYSELSEKSNALANFLVDKYGELEGKSLAVLLNDSLEYVISIISILKAGAFFVPLDPANPIARINFILADCQSIALITEQKFELNIDHTGETLLYKKLSNLSVNSENSPVIAKSIAYAIYTSGSTGKPKGVKVGHRSLSNYAAWAATHYFGQNDSGNSGLFTSFSFDLTLTSIFVPLVHGKTIFVQNENFSVDEKLIRILQNPDIDLIKLTPSHINLLSVLDLTVNGAKTFICGGEALSMAQVNFLLGLGSNIKIYNEYGPTEATVGCIVKEITAQDDRVLIGRPIANTKIKIVDQNGECSLGKTGEILIGGACLSLGYLNKPEETNQAFIVDEKSQELFYKSGDLGRLLPTGELEYLGRKDEQIKIRGYRVELGEIEHQIKNHPAISGVTVIYKKGILKEGELSAFIVSDQNIELSELRNFLKSDLPGYMIPQHFFIIDNIPLTTNGKVDKRMLGEMESLGLTSSAEYLAPSNAEEKTMVEIWSEVIGKEPENIGIKDRFFEVGGDSIKAIRLMAALRNKMNYQLSVEDIYNNDTIEEIIRYVSENETEINQKNKKRQAHENTIRIEMEALKERVLTTNELENDNIEDLYPMSDIEKGMVFGYLMNEGTGTYHDQMVFKSQFHEFNIDQFKQALDLLTEKHQILRTSFNLSDFECEIQIVHKKVVHNVHFEDLSDLPSVKQEDAIKAFLKEQLDKRFEVLNAPLWRMSVFKLEFDNYIFLFEFHHAIIDGWSDASFITELNNLYLKLSEDEAYKPALLKSSYKDFIIQDQLNHTDDAVANFWKEELAQYERLDLFTEQEDLDKYVRINNPAYLKRIESLAGELKTTVKTVALSAYIYLLKTLNSNAEIVTGLVTNTRPNTEDGDKILGCFLNTIPLKMAVDSNEECAAFISKVHKKLIALKNNESLSLLAITAICQEKSELSNPFFDVMFNYVDFHIFEDVEDDDSKELKETRNEQLNVESHERTNTFFDFTVSTTAGNFGLLISATNKLKSGLSINYIGNLYFKIVDFILEDATQTLKQSDFLDKQEKLELVETFNSTQVDYPIEQTVIELFEQEVLKGPNKVALVTANESLTYNELNERSNSLAHFLKKNYEINPLNNRGLRGNTNIGVMLERSVESIISMLGILKAGACYVPLNHDYPKDRIQFVVQNAALDIIISEEELWGKHGISAKSLIDIKQAIPIAKGLENKEISNPEKTNNLADIAAIFYTSGSTGQPKGVLQTHRMMRNLIKWDVEQSGVGRGLKHLQYNSFSFDACVQDVFFALSSAGSIYMAKESSRLEYQDLLNEIVTNEIEVLFMPFSALNSFCLAVEIDTLQKHHIKYIISTAEQLYVNDRLKTFLENNPEVELRNYYGPSETHIVTSYKMSSKLDNIESPSPVGKPISNSTIYILDSDKNLVPKGVIGEIYIGGENLAAGYLNLEKETGDKFVQNPFKAEGKLYKTGDQGHWRPDGNLLFLGRKDDQIKIRGFRVELGEIEYALQKNEAIEKAVVISKENQQAEKELVAYIESVGSTDQNVNEVLNASDVRTYLKKTLPDYMLPAYYVQLDKIPLTNNGKTDKKSLPDPEDFGLTSGLVFEAPRNETEEKVLKIWQEVLQRKRIGIKEDFFALGGHSLKVVKLSNKYQKELGVKISLKNLFEHSSIASHADLISATEKNEFVQIEKVTEQEYYPISDAQRRLWVLSQFEDASVSYNMFDDIYLDKEIDIACFKKAIHAAISRHEILRTIFKEDEKGEIRQWVLNKADLNFEIDYKDFRSLANNKSQDAADKKTFEQVNAYITEDCHTPFDFEKGPLLRASILQVKEHAFVFYYNMHHIISDGVSGSILEKDVLAFYEAFIQNKQPIGLEELRIQYKDYSAWQLSQLKEETFKVHREYWLTRLEGQLPVIDLPSTKQRPKLKTSNGRTLGAYLGKALSSKLKSHSQAQGGTLFMGLMTSLNAILYRYTGQNDLIIGSPIAGRDHLDLENQIGFYVNTLALRNDVNGTDSFDALFARLKQNTLNAYTHQMYPFDRLVDELDLARDTSRSAVFDIMLVLQNNTDNEVSLNPNGVELSVEQENEIFDYGAKTSKFDLLFTVQEQGEYISFLVEYNTDVYEQKTIEKLIVHYKALMVKMLNEPTGELDQIVYLDEDEQEQLLFSFNDTKIDYSHNMVMQLFEEQIAKTPNKLALVYGDESLTYKELNERCNSLAHYLKNAFQIGRSESDNVSSTAKVGVMLERSIHSVIAMIGIMKTGAYYVPIDPDYPTERVAFIVEDSKLQTIISEAELWKKHDLKNSTLIAIKELDLLSTEFNKANLGNLENTNHPDDGAFVIYTSGSTGRPKGILQTHRMMRNLTQWDMQHSGIERDLKHLHYNSFSFDVSLQDCWSPLNSGGTVYITNEKDRIDFPAIWNYIVENEIEVLSFPFSALQQLIIQNVEQDLTDLKIKHIVSAGEQLIINSALQFFLENNPTVELHNHYGPSETHVVTSHKMSAQLGNLESNASIGKPISNSSIYILDAHQNVVPQGVAGELYIGGENLASAYLNLEDETSERFIENPFVPGERLYKTGDQGVWRLDGNIDFLGRKDDQVKIRGYRIELQEVEHALQTHKAIQEAVVIVKINEEAEKELIAYITTKDKMDSSELRAYLTTIFPAYMLPSYFVQLESFPLTSNGKIDKRALPNPQGLGLTSGVEYLAPQNEIEEKLLAIWAAVLQRDGFGIKDDFFTLGGHSLKAAKVVSKINQEFKSGLKIGNIFSTPTIEDLSYNIQFALKQKELKSKIQNMKEIEL